MILTTVPFESLRVATDLSRSRVPSRFIDRLSASIEAIGLAEPLKVAPEDGDSFVVVDGVLRWHAIRRIRQHSPDRFNTVDVYLVDHEIRYEIRYQTDIYQDLRPSQLAALVEYLHESDRISKRDIAQYLGVSSATLRNYTGLWRLVRRGGLFAAVVELMDAGVIPASNPYAWLRLNAKGVRLSLETLASESSLDLEAWLARARVDGSGGHRPQRFSLRFIESLTSTLPPDCYRNDTDLRRRKQAIGQRRSSEDKLPFTARASAPDARRNLQRVVETTDDPVLRIAAEELLARV